MNTYEIGAEKWQIMHFLFAVKDSEFELKMYKRDPKSDKKIPLSADEILDIFCKEFDRIKINNGVDFMEFAEMPNGYTKQVRLKIRKKDDNTLLCERQEGIFRQRAVEQEHSVNGKEVLDKCTVVDGRISHFMEKAFTLEASHVLDAVTVVSKDLNKRRFLKKLLKQIVKDIIMFIFYEGFVHHL